MSAHCSRLGRPLHPAACTKTNARTHQHSRITDVKLTLNTMVQSCIGKALHTAHCNEHHEARIAAMPGIPGHGCGCFALQQNNWTACSGGHALIHWNAQACQTLPACHKSTALWVIYLPPRMPKAWNAPVHAPGQAICRVVLQIKKAIRVLCSGSAGPCLPLTCICVKILFLIFRAEITHIRSQAHLPQWPDTPGPRHLRFLHAQLAVISHKCISRNGRAADRLHVLPNRTNSLIVHGLRLRASTPSKKHWHGQKF